MDQQQAFPNAHAIEVAADLRETFGAGAFAQALERRVEAAALDYADGLTFWNEVCELLARHDEIAQRRGGYRR